ncbi:MAG: hypothetical protein QM597_06095 [Aeromicrobium sp.]|uniref:hypothetical protein n=1 Tax=Aeromicrobium sp. TaxID=1871063 RepID=UPI0039E64E61
MIDFDSATAALARAVHDGPGAPLTDAALEVGASAASQGIGLVEAIDAVAGLYSDREPPFAAVRAVTQAWTGSAPQFVTGTDCHDPLTALASSAHLRTRLDDLYRQAVFRGGEEPAATHVLVVVELGCQAGSCGHGLEAALSGLEVAHALTVAFPAHETVAGLTQVRFAALTRQEDADRLGLTLLSRVLAETLTGQPEPRVWVERLPRDEAAVTWLLSRLTE